MFGHIFSDYLVGYDFWGYGDIDLIYGNISKFITRDMLEQFDCIRCRKDCSEFFVPRWRNSPQTINITPTGLYTENEFKSPIFLYIFVGGWLQR